MRGRYFEELLLRVLAQIRSSTKSDWLEFTIHTRPRNLSSDDAVCRSSQTAIGRDPVIAGDLLSSMLHDDLAAHTAKIRPTAPPRSVTIQ